MGDAMPSDDEFQESLLTPELLTEMAEGRTDAHMRIVVENDDLIGTFSQQLASDTRITALHMTGFIPVSANEAVVKALATSKSLRHVSMSSNMLSTEFCVSLNENLVTKKMVSLSMQWNALNCRSMGSLASLVQKNWFIERLELSYNRIGDHGAQALAEMLRSNKALHALILRGNVIGDDGAEYLSAGLRLNRALTELDLSENPIGPSGASTLLLLLKVNRHIKTFNIAGVQTGFDLEYADALSGVLSNNTTLTDLNIGSSRLGSQGAEALVDALSRNSTLTRLDLYGNFLRDSGLQHVCLALRHATNLRQLNLAGNDAGEGGGRSAIELLRTNTRLVNVDLSGNGFPPSFGQQLIELNVFRLNPNLQTVNVLACGQSEELAAILHRQFEEAHKATPLLY